MLFIGNQLIEEITSPNLSIQAVFYNKLENMQKVPKIGFDQKNHFCVEFSCFQSIEGFMSWNEYPHITSYSWHSFFSFQLMKQLVKGSTWKIHKSFFFFNIWPKKVLANFGPLFDCIYQICITWIAEKKWRKKTWLKHTK